MSTFEQPVSDWLQVCGACEGCDNKDRLDEVAHAYVTSGPTTIVAEGQTVSGEKIEVEVPARSAMDLPPDVEARQVGLEISKQLLANEDPLRCADGCIIGDSDLVFHSVLAQVASKNRDGFHRRISQRVSARDIYDGLESTPPVVVRDVIGDYIAEIL